MLNSLNLNYKKIKIEKDKEYWLALLFTLLPVAIYAIGLANKTMPFAEGWYTYYAQLINEGNVVYRDFEYLFMPGYITFIALFTRIFGYSIIALRILGVIFFVIITFFAFKIFNELFTPAAACFGAVTTAFYLQSEIVQIFYDYIRFMDIFAYINIFQLIRMTKYIINGGVNKNYKITLFAGMANAMVLMTKQNIGLLFGFFVLCYFIFLFLYTNNNSHKKNITLNLLSYGAGAAIVFGGYGIYLLANGALKACLMQTLLGATEAKGGVATILFNWLVEGEESFLSEQKIVYFVVAAAAVIFLLGKFFPARKANDKSAKKVFYIFGGLTTLSVILIYLFEAFAEKFTDRYVSYSYGFYTFATLVFFIMMAAYIGDIFRENKKFKEYIGFFLLFGAIFAIGYGVGMSGGLSQSQIALSTGVIICTLFSLCQGRFKWVSMSLVATGALCFVVFCGAFKYVSTYSWWGLTDYSIWESTETTDIDIFKGIKVSEEVKEIYEGVNDIVQEYSEEDEDIFAFPHIPILYSATDRSDPGTFTKVQWYDVSTDASVEEDLTVVEEATPKVIIIYDIPQYAIDGHEKAFNDDEQSSTTTMLKQLKRYCLRNDYTAKGYFKINSLCGLTVYVKEDEPLNWCSSGVGTKADPFVITSVEQFLNFGKMVNAGATFEGLYVALDTDIDLSGIDDYVPIGSEKLNCAFKGTFDGQGHVVRNLNLIKDMNYVKSKDNEKKPNDMALFGSITGTIMNLGMEDCKITGFCVAGIARHSGDSDSSIVNCYVKNCEFYGKHRAGAIADDYIGYVYNCIAIDTELDADSRVGVISYRDAGISFEECYTSIKYYNDLTNIITTDEINTPEFANKLNGNVTAYVEYKTTSKKSPRPIAKWQIKDSELVFSGETYTTVQREYN